VIGIRDVAFHHEVLDWLDRDFRIDIVGAAGEPGRLVPFLTPDQADVALLCPMMARQLSHPSMKARLPRMLLVAQEMTIPVLRDAIDLGAWGVFAWPEEREELSDEVVRAGTARAVAPTTRGRAVAILGSRGGAGSTFVATHLAAMFAERGIRCALVDLEAGIGDLTVALGVRPEDRPRTIADLLPVIDELTPQHVMDVLHEHSGGFAVLLAPSDDQLSSSVPCGLYEACIGHLKAEFQVVLLHLPRGKSDVVDKTLEPCEQALLVVTLDLFSLFGARRAISALGLDQVQTALRIVVNRVSRGEITTADVQRILGVRPRAAIRFDPRVKQAQDRGQLLAARSRRAIKDLRHLARTLHDEWIAADREGGM
jgi:pilus assembly protein CpaE